MSFDYNLYQSGCLIFPIIVAAIAAPVLILCTKKVFKIAIEQEGNWSDSGGTLAGIIISCICCALSVGPLLNGGLCLLVERETDAIEIQGEITQITELPRIIFPALTNDYNSEKVGVRIFVDGHECVLPTRGDLQAGDYAIVQYLPRSGYVLDISSVPHEGQTPQQSHNRYMENILSCLVMFVIAYMYFRAKGKQHQIIKA